MCLKRRGKHTEAPRVLESVEAHYRDDPGQEALAVVSRVDALLAQGCMVETEELLWRAMARAVEARDDFPVTQLLIPMVPLHAARGRLAELFFLGLGAGLLQHRLDR